MNQPLTIPIKDSCLDHHFEQATLSGSLISLEEVNGRILKI